MNTSQKSGSVRYGFSLVEVLVVITILALLASIVIPVVSQARELARRTKCRTNVKGIADACIQYMDDDKLHRDSLAGNSLPRPVAPMTLSARGNWGTTNPASLWMLMRPHKFVGRETFLCPSSPIYRDDNFRVPDPGDNRFEFNTLSYSYLSQVPFTDANPAAAAQGQANVTITTRSNPGLRASELAIVADANPHTIVGKQEFSGDAMMNSLNHDGVGQNVAFADGHVGWFTTPVIPGTKPLSSSDKADNIYMPCNGSGSTGKRGAINDALLLP
jgi:prepilin-type N-terminal cleavage/methylation domain-containing protein/prepilin-type processing-associated H-X9-DG protein